MKREAMTNWLTQEEAVQYLKIGKSTLYDLARKEKVPAHKMGWAWRFDAEVLDEWLKAGKGASNLAGQASGGKDGALSGVSERRK